MYVPAKTKEVDQTMAIADRNLKVGTRLVAKYKKVQYICEVVQTDEGVRYRLENGTPDGLVFKSPSAAGSAVMNGAACNGWKFWSLANPGEGQDRGSATDAAHDEQPDEGEQGGNVAKKRGGRVIKRVPNQQGAPKGQVRFFCSACADSFFAPAGQAPGACPKGHQA